MNIKKTIFVLNIGYVIIDCSRIIKEKMENWMKLIKSVFVLFVIFAVGSIVLAQAPQMPPAKVVVSTVTEQEVSKTNQISGIVDYDKISSVSPEVAGLVDKLYFDEGSFVKKDDVLATLNTDFAQKDLDVLKRQLEENEINAENTKRNLERSEKLYKSSSTSQKAYEDLLYAYKALLKKIDVAKINIQKLELQIEKSSIRAPFDGVILKKSSEVGQWIERQSPICTVASTDDTIVKVAVNEDIINYLISGNDILLKIDALHKEMTGKIDGLVPVADIKSKTFVIKIKIPYFKNAIQNMSATVHVPVSDKMKLRIISRDALIANGGKYFVYTIKDKKAEILPVNIIAYIGEYVGVDNPYIVKGMPVVTDGNDRLMPNQPVTVVDENYTMAERK